MNINRFGNRRKVKTNNFYQYKYFVGDNMPLKNPPKSFKGDKSMYIMVTKLKSL